MTTDELQKSLSRVNNNLSAIVQVHLYNIAQDLTNELKALWPEDTGKSKASFDVETKDGLTVAIINATKYAGNVHYRGDKTLVVDRFAEYAKSKKVDLEKRLALEIESEIRNQIDEALR